MIDDRPRSDGRRDQSGGAALLAVPVAQRIIERVNAGMSLSVSVADTAGLVLASTEPRRLGERSQGAAALLAGRAPPAGEPGRLLAYADRTVGAILLHGADPESPVLEVARTLAELIIHQLAVLDQLPHRRWARGKFLDDLLHGRLTGSPEAVLHQAAVLEVDLAPPRLVALVDLAGMPQPPAPAHASSLAAIDGRRRLSAAHEQLVELACAHVAAGADDLCACLGVRWLAILPALAPDGEAAARELAARLEALLAELARGLGLETRAGIGRACAGWPELPLSFRDARFAVEMGQALGEPRRVFTVEALGLAGLVCHTDPEAKGALAGRMLAPLAAEPELLATLAAFLRNGLAPSLAARELSVHRHTLGYRLDKIAALTGLDPRRFHDAAQLQVAMLLQRVEPSEPEQPAARGRRP